jgi:thiamine-monophosphate kinase
VAGRRLPAEFDLIARYFAPLTAGRPEALGLADDVALLDIDPSDSLIVTADALIAGVHFLPEDPPALIARKMLRVNLSDLAGKGARPLGYLMTCAFPDDVDEAWLADFTAGLAADQREFGLALLGGDTTGTPGPLALSLTALGRVRRGQALLRSAARAGDVVMVSGTLGDGALGLDVQRREFAGLPAAARDFLIDRYRLPQPRLALGQALAERGLARAGMDISDGLLADLGHICQASGVGAVLRWSDLPLSPAAQAMLSAAPELNERIVAGGDDYELLVTVPADRVDAALGAAGALGLPLVAIGRIEAGAGVRLLDPAGAELRFARTGYQHF